MLEKPLDLTEGQITAHVRSVYGLEVRKLAFLPIGADANTAVFRLKAPAAVYFLKLRRGDFEEITVSVPLALYSQGLKNIILPLQTLSGDWWAKLEAYTSILYPFIEGQDGYQVRLSDQQWQEFGAACRLIHTARLPLELMQRIPQETYSTHWREMVKGFQSLVTRRTFSDPVAARMGRFMQDNEAVINRLLRLAHRLAQSLQTEPPEPVLVHSDLHAGNLFITPAGALYIVDWDNPKLAPKEHDLMHIGGSPTWDDPRTARLFYQGYQESQGSGAVEINRTALAYYRCERIILDIAAFGEQLLLSEAGGADREQSYRFFTSNFLPGHEIDIAFKTAERTITNEDE